LSVGDCAVLACLWEATAAKPGNVYRGADFEDVGYPEFLTSACAIRPALEAAAASGVGAAILAATEATRAAVGVNTNLGMVLLLAPLAAARLPLVEGVAEVLNHLSREDARWAYAAIRCASPGGLGAAPEADVRDTETPDCTLLEAMQMAAARDVVARQYAENYAEVWRTADLIAAAYAAGAALERAIVDAHVDLLAARPDTLIVRKCGAELGAEASARAAAALQARRAGADAYHAALADFDFWLRSDGHRRNPGATADIIAAALFALLRGGRLTWPVRFSERAGC
jgi:triphosphoribosyl-dephospho-CoA synthase